MAAISSITNGEAMSSVRTKLNTVITEINLLDPTGWIDYSATSTIVGWSSFTTKIIRYRVIGKQVFVEVDLNGTSNATTASFTLPFNVSNSASNSVNSNWSTNNGTSLLGYFITLINTNTVVGYVNFGTSWTSSGTKRIVGQFFIEIA